MKASLLLTAVILLAGGLFINRSHHELAVLKTEREDLATEARDLGISVSDNPGEARDSAKLRGSSRIRSEHPDRANQTAASLIAFAREMEEKQKSGGGGRPDSEMQKQILEIIEQVTALTPAELRVVIDQLRADGSISDDLRQGLLGFTIMTMAERNPQAALNLFTQLGKDASENNMHGHVVSSALSTWAKDDPLAALEWVRKNGKDHPEIVTDDAKRGIIRGAAQQDPALAFQLIDELGFENPERATHEILQAARTPEAKLAAIDLLRKRLEGQADPELRDNMLNSAFSGLANTRNETFESTTTWLADASLNEKELAAFAKGLHYHQTKNDTGKWIGWLAESLPADKLSGSVENMVSNWTRQDFHAAGTWLASAPDDAAKAPAVKAYAETVAEYEPETAAQWALTLPPGETRQQTLRSIYQRWPQDDAAAKEAFALKHGLQP